jgi:hypothetical protein
MIRMSVQKTEGYEEFSTSKLRLTTLLTDSSRLMQMDGAWEDGEESEFYMKIE